MEHRVIAIDGPSGAGKSTIAKAVGRLLGFLHVDSGALYRIMTLQALKAGIDCNDAGKVAAFANDVKVEFVVRDGAVAYLVDGEEPGDAIRTPAINASVSPVSKVPEVRARVTAWLRGMRELGDLIVEGRDIGSVVFPDSPARFYLDADPDERTRRRLKEDVARGFMTEADADKVRASLLARDKIDSSRKTAPLKVADGAVVIDSTDLTIDEVLAAILENLPAEYGV
jgi:cytidylate kinase